MGNTKIIASGKGNKTKAFTMLRGVKKSELLLHSLVETIYTEIMLSQVFLLRLKE